MVIKRIIVCAHVLSIGFPYFKMLSATSYNQPYYILTGLLVILVCLNPRRMNKYIVPLAVLAVFGFLLYVYSIFTAGVVYKNLAILLVFVNPLILALSIYLPFRQYSTDITLALKVILIVWVAISLVQVWMPGLGSSLVVSQERITSIASSGRGVLGLAPEPTHNGFHMMFMSIFLMICGVRWLGSVGVVASLLLSLSSTLFVTVLGGGLLYVFINPKFRYIIKLMFLMLMVIIAIGFFPGSRVASLYDLISSTGMSAILLDVSANMRISGAVAGFILCWSSFGVPHGIDISVWAIDASNLSSKFWWIVELSPNGPASGFGQLAYYGGLPALIMALVPVCYIYRTLRNERFFIIVGTTIFFSQFSLASPHFGIFIGLALAFIEKKKNYCVA